MAAGHGPLRRRLSAVLVMLAVALPACRAAAEAMVPVAPQQAREAAVAAWQAGDLATARLIAQNLVARDASDPLAQHLLALIALAEGKLPEARQAARRAYGGAQSDLQRRSAALVAANVAAREARGLALRYWLRQATDATDDATARAQGRAALNNLRALSPWSSALRFSLSPSSNVNGGADSAFNIVEGVDYIGTLDGDAQALSGVIGTMTGDLGYRIAQSATSETRLTSRLYLKRVALSAEAKEQAVSLTASDLATTSLDLGVTHLMRPEGMQGTLELGLSFGLNEEGDDAARSLRLDATRRRPLGRTGEITLGVGWDMEQDLTGARQARQMPSLNFAASHRLASGDRIGASAVAYGVHSEIANQRRFGGQLRMQYTLGQPVGSFSLGGSLGASYTRYPNYMVLFDHPEGGRRDVTLFGEVTLGLDKMSWAGFAPTVTLRASQSDSNVSAFDTRQIGVMIGIKSLF
ncbi:hypothetical protein SAMN04488103_103281 [Gemmobacter aquatilis]|uniref:DUF560 domain-containing protein n=1 Tax=Gemmobacter aquatilis TaxID=933059 RepID=A0A1H8ECE3_9RHOB|nr:hypothetical protein [Gemmobacter aquatilis]SEN17189.1 hypothetical protein SAMN04488103_103281 [Gemmobacter aquatilis]